MYTLQAIKKPRKYDEIRLLKEHDELFDIRRFFDNPRIKYSAILQQTIFDVDEIGDYGMFDTKHNTVASDKFVYSSYGNLLYDFYSYGVKGFCINDARFIYDCDYMTKQIGERLYRPLDNWHVRGTNYKTVLSDMGSDFWSGIVIEQKAPYLSTISSYGQDNKDGYIKIVIFKNNVDGVFKITITTNRTDEFQTKVQTLTNGSKITANEVQILINSLKELIITSRLPINIDITIKRLEEFKALINKESIFEGGVLSPAHISNTLARVKGEDKTIINSAIKKYKEVREAIRNEENLIYGKPYIDFASGLNRNGSFLPNDFKGPVL